MDGALDVVGLSQRNGPMVLRRCRQLLRDEDEAMDASQDVFVRLLEHRERLQARYPSSLLYRIATFYLPPTWGFPAMQWLKRHRYL